MNTQTTIEYKRCNRCVMDTSDCEISFDEQGNCNHCNTYFNTTTNMSYQGKKSDREFDALIETMKRKGKNSKYDCVIGVSGGVDSTYVAYLAKERGLRVLLVHLDNGWNTPIGEENVKNIVNLLGFDFEVYKLDWQEFRQMQVAFLKASVPDIEAPTDMAIPAALHYFAKKYNVKYIVSGGNFATEGILPNSWFYNAKDTRYVKSILKQFCPIEIKKFPFFGWKEEAWCKLFHGIKMVYFLNLVPYSKDDAIQILEKNLHWKYYGGKHYESLYTGFEQAYILPEKFNIDYRKATFSTQICAGTMTREQVLEELSKPAYNPETIQDEIKQICDKLELSVDEFNAIMKEQPKYYWDYPNDEKKLAFIYSVYRFLTGKKDYRK